MRARAGELTGAHSRRACPPRRFQDIVHVTHLHHFSQLTSCVGANSCGTDSGTLYYGATVISSDDGAHEILCAAWRAVPGPLTLWQLGVPCPLTLSSAELAHLLSQEVTV